MTELRRRIIDASVTLVDEKGVRSISFREVARRAGVSHQAPYHHFGNVHGILRAIAEEGFSALATAMRTAADAAGDDPIERLTQAGRAYVGFAHSNTGHFRVMFQHALVDVHDETQPLREAGDSYRTLVELATAVCESGLTKETRVDELVRLAWSAVHGVSVLLVEGVLGRKTPATKDELAAIAASVADHMGRLLRSH
ncbi:MAG: TetR/AcrR family transcriptional regulator [Myxococcota bacterium]